MIEIKSITANAIINDNNWHPTTYLRTWHEKLRWKLIVWLLKSLRDEKKITWVRTETGAGNRQCYHRTYRGEG